MRRGLYLLVLVLLSGGCGEKPVRSTRGPTTAKLGSTANERKQTLATAAAALETWDESFSDEDQRKHVFNQLNSWSEAAELTDLDAELVGKYAWRPSPLIQTLPADLQAINALYEIKRLSFDQTDVDYLRETTWLRYIARRIGKSVKEKDETLRDQALAHALFDWTMRNIALAAPSWDAAADPWIVPPDAIENQYTPYLSIYVGRAGTVARAWVFLELIRQAGLQGILLGVPDESQPDGIRPWCVGVFIPGKNTDPATTDLLLFDPRLGMPLPGELPGQTLTLSQVRAKPELLRRLDMPNDPYPIKNDQASKAAALVALNPSGLTRRMALLQLDMLDDPIAERPEGTPDSPGMLKLAQAAGIEKIALWRHPFVVARSRANPTPAQLADLKRRTVIYDVELPLPKEGGGKKRMDEAADLNYDPETGMVIRKGSGMPPPSLLELNRPGEIDSKTGEILSFNPEKDAVVDYEIGKALRHGRLMQLRGAWDRRGRGKEAMVGDADRIEVPQDLRGAIYWLMLCKQSDASLRTLFNAPLTAARWKTFDAFLATAKVSPVDRAALRDLTMVACILPEQLDILTRALSAEGNDPAKVQATIKRILALKSSNGAADLFIELLEPVGIPKQNAANFGQSFVAGNRLPGDTYPLEMKKAFLELLREMNRRGTYWLAQIQADSDEFDAAERFYLQYDSQGYADWAGAVNLGLAELYLKQAEKLEQTDAEQAIKLRLQGIERLEADRSPQRTGSLLKAKFLRESLEK